MKRKKVITQRFNHLSDSGFVIAMCRSVQGLICAWPCKTEQCETALPYPGCRVRTVPAVKAAAVAQVWVLWSQTHNPGQNQKANLFPEHSTAY